jgi:glycosyltransferase involved in cell wall biosynthesis
MKILWIPHTGWHIPQRAHIFCRALAERHEVHVTDWVADFASPRDYFSLRYVRNFAYRCYRDGRIVVHGIPRISPALFSTTLRRLNTIIFARLVRDLIERHRIDVVVGTFVVPPPKAPRLIFDLFDENVVIWRSRAHTLGYADEIEQAEAAYLKDADAVVAVSSVLADKARGLGARGPVYHIPNGVDLQRFAAVNRVAARARLNTHGALVGSVGNHDNAAELDKILDAAKLLGDTKLTFLIAGRGAAVARARSRAHSEGLSNVVVQGYMAPDEAVETISALDVGMCSYARTTMDDARSPMRLLMYAAAGVPTVCTDLEEVRRMNFPNVVRVADDAQSFADGIRCALQRPHISPPDIQDYDLHRIVNHYEAVLKG